MYQIPAFSVTLTKTQEGGARSRQRYHSLFLSTIYSSTVRLKLSDASPKTSSLQKKKVFGTRVTPLTLQKLFILTGNSALVKFLLKAKA